MTDKISRSSHEQALEFFKACDKKKTLKISDTGLSIGIEDVADKMRKLREDSKKISYKIGDREIDLNDTNSFISFGDMDIKQIRKELEWLRKTLRDGK